MNFITLPRRFQCKFHYFDWALSFTISLLYPGDFIGNFITLPGCFHCNFHYYIRGISLGTSLLYLGDFNVNFIIIPGHFHWEFHYYTQGISLGISLLYPGTFTVNFIIMAGCFHCNFIIIPTSKHMTTMPDVAVGWLRSLLRTLGENLGRAILHLGVAGLITPIWDVLAPEGEQEEALNRLRTGSISPCFPIRQAVPLGLPQALDRYWAHWARFFIAEKLYISTYNTLISILPFSSNQGSQE